MTSTESVGPDQARPVNAGHSSPMKRPQPRWMEPLFTALIVVLVAALILATIVAFTSSSNPPMWPFLLVIVLFMVLVVVRIFAYFFYQFPPYDTTQLLEQGKERNDAVWREKK